jgi:hypothetical protein
LNNEYCANTEKTWVLSENLGIHLHERDQAMTLREFAFTCVVTRIFSFFALFLCIGLVASHRQLLEWTSAAFISCIATFILLQFSGRKSCEPTGCADERIGNSNFEKMSVLGSLWVPIVLSAFSIFSIDYWNIDFTQIAWVLVVLGGHVGCSASSLYSMKSAR